MVRSPQKQRRIAPRTGLLIGILPLLVLGGLIVWGMRPDTPAPSGQAAITIPHLHGIGYSADGRQIIVAAHDGLRIVQDGIWSIPASPPHDYMGYAPVDTGFYSSGHPAPGARQTNPLGLIKSTDGGATLIPLGFAGQSDFHVMGVGYVSHAIYVVNAVPNATLGVGLYASMDEGKTWIPCAAQGLPSAPLQLAVHPTQPATVAIGTDQGLFLSSDSGATFTRIGPAAPATAVAWSAADGHLLFGGSTLTRYDMVQRQLVAIPIPTTAPLTALAINPIAARDLTLATHDRDIYRSPDGGQTWTQLAASGRGVRSN